MWKVETELCKYSIDFRLASQLSPLHTHWRRLKYLQLWFRFPLSPEFKQFSPPRPSLNGAKFSRSSQGGGKDQIRGSRVLRKNLMF